MQRHHIIGFVLGPVVFASLLLLPPPPGMPPGALKVAAIAALMALWWITEAVPIPATAMLPLVLYPVLGVMPSKAAAYEYANHLIFLFLGGFFIAIAMEKWGLHRRLALHTIRIVGVSPPRIVLGFMLATAALSMWISNTATAMMMVPIALAVIQQTAEHLTERGSEVDTAPTRFRFATALMLGIAYAASIGGVATIIGTPPNTIAVGLVEKMYGQQIGFGQWMALGLPLSAVMLVLAWLYLVKVAVPPEIAELIGGRQVVSAELKKLGRISREELGVLVVFALVAAAWIGRGIIRAEGQMVHDATIAMAGALALFIVPVSLKERRFLLDWQSAVKVPWDIILLFGGGLSLAKGFEVSGLAEWIGHQVSGMAGLGLVALVVFVIVLSMLLTEVTSNTATAAILVPVAGAVAVGVSLHPLGLMFAASTAASCAFMLPVATPPNAVVFGSRYLTIPQMVRIGFFLNLLGVLLITLAVVCLMPVVWHIDLNELPAWALSK
jgi:sodium-dependent dicarboxylate transporter 2/3/5